MAKKVVAYKASEVRTEVKKIEMTGTIDVATGQLVTAEGGKDIIGELAKLGDLEITITAVTKVEEEKEL
jgi:hypothetical protein